MMFLFLLLLHLGRAAIRQERKQVVRRLRCCGRGADDGAIILFQNSDPTGYVIGVTHRRHDPESSADK
jgi:hypothetical protein